MRCATEQRMRFKICSLKQLACHSVPNEAYERRPLYFDFFTRDSFFPPFYMQLPIRCLPQAQQDYHVNRQLARSLFFIGWRYWSNTAATLCSNNKTNDCVLWPKEVWITAWIYYLSPRNKIQVNFNIRHLHCYMGYKNIMVLIYNDVADINWCLSTK
jgi:hypothetical protein